jgi:hypothetical protein
VVGFGKNGNNVTVVGKLQSLGFRKESAGRRIYYRGPTTQDDITATREVFYLMYKWFHVQ